MSSFWAMLGRMRNIRRWGLMRNTQEEDVLQHTAQCAHIAHALALLGNARLGKAYDLGAVVLRALYHETAEVLTGDLATPVKYFNPELRAAYANIEREAQHRLLAVLPDDLAAGYAPLLSPPQDDVAVLVKAADRLCALCKCQEEQASGNGDFAAAAADIRHRIQQSGCPEALIFMEEFLPAFALTLDELAL